MLECCPNIVILSVLRFSHSLLLTLSERLGVGFPLTSLFPEFAAFQCFAISMKSNYAISIHTYSQLYVTYLVVWSEDIISAHRHFISVYPPSATHPKTKMLQKQNKGKGEKS